MGDTYKAQSHGLPCRSWAGNYELGGFMLSKAISVFPPRFLSKTVTICSRYLTVPRTIKEKIATGCHLVPHPPLAVYSSPLAPTLNRW